MHVCAAHTHQWLASLHDGHRMSNFSMVVTPRIRCIDGQFRVAMLSFHGWSVFSILRTSDTACAPLDSIALIVIAFKNVQEASRRAVCCCRIRHSVDRVSSSRQPFFLLLSFLFRCLASTTVCYHFYFPPLDQLTVFVCNFARESAEHISGPYSSTRTGQAHAIRTSERKTKTKHWKNAIREDECWACVLSGTPMCILIRF